MRLALIIMLCLIATPGALASSLTPERAAACDSLRAIGFEITDDWLEAYAESAAALDEQMKAWGIDPAMSGHSEAYDMLQFLGSGFYDDETGDYAPASDQVYAFDAEVLDIERMYTVFLTRAALLVPGLEMGDISEDLKRLDANLEGRRSVTFTMDSVEFSRDLKSMRDWINLEIVDCFNDALKQLGYDGQLYIVSDDVDQIVTIVYGSQSWADTVRAAIGTEDLMKQYGLLDLIRGLFR